ncbi:MAG: 3-deoxy-D-manno-octulosonic acid transferase [Rickettsiales bacterium]|nr:3-deoxy-D-manno-octulosonic acid transferase [Rickettsiales bacterium]
MWLYKILSVLSFPIVELWIFWRIFKKKDDPVRFKEKFGVATQERPNNEVIWIHAVSVGEAKSALSLVDEILKRDKKVSVLLTTTTLTSAEIVGEYAKKSGGRLIHQFCVLDLLYQVRSFLTFWQPSKVIFLESEIWPNIINESKRLGANIYLANARMSDKSAKRWQYLQYFFWGIFDMFDGIIAQSKDDKARFETLTKQEVAFVGNLKAQFREIEYDRDNLVSLQNKIGKRPIFLAASTHRGEEEIIIDTHLKLKKDFPDILTIVVIRHPNRAHEVETLLKKISYAKRSRKEEVKNDKELYLVDTIGELGIFYKLVNFAFIGGSLQEIGGHNPLEPIMLDTAVISGEHVFNFREIYDDLVKKSACIMVKDSSGLYETARYFIANPSEAKDLAKKAKVSFDLSKDVARSIVDLVL